MKTASASAPSTPTAWGSATCGQLIRLPFNQFDHDGATLGAPWTDMPALCFKFETKTEDVEAAIADGVFTFEAKIDSLLIE